MNRKQDFYPQALAIAEELYAHKFRSGGKRPYIEHPLMLVEILRAHGFDDDDLLCGAILHDGIEENDHNQALVARLAKRCPVRVFNLLLEVTDAPGLAREARRQEQIDRAHGYTRSAALIRLADKLANMHDILSDPPKWAPKHILSYSEFAMRVVEICRPAAPGLADECKMVFEQIEARYTKPVMPEISSQSPS
ncbi:HD domain-containing protein [Pseudomonas amygdali]|uniref:HD domain-containing protein n=1 Tax=Pseudomonas amygdali pv. lachrymans str. M301315 TaxID=629260 RepID=A0AAD0PX11_PSEAV|nr:HD domain-containing protein [Pseudomonas amygdali]AXH60314.1 HD domain-containing protein [Pseudomonas amygdali pv. lachrymans str. M301315]